MTEKEFQSQLARIEEQYGEYSGERTRILWNWFKATMIFGLKMP